MFARLVLTLGNVNKIYIENTIAKAWKLKKHFMACFGKHFNHWTTEYLSYILHTKDKVTRKMGSDGPLDSKLCSISIINSNFRIALKNQLLLQCWAKCRFTFYYRLKSNLKSYWILKIKVKFNSKFHFFIKTRF